TLEDTTSQVALTYGTSLSAGPASESWQTLTVLRTLVSCTTPEATLFSSAPAFGTDGYVRFTLNPLQNGNCTYSIALQDNGG
ncbi:hypothetical protein ABTK28_21960, partial [Acinetobacter baumannii]